ncbi:MAG: hypothetical protein WCC57_03935 [Paracoccaceae bacterium]
MKTFLIIAVVILALGGPARSGPPSDALFVEGIFADLPDGQVMTYAHRRSGSEAPGFVQVTDGRMRLLTQSSGTERSLTLTLEESGKQREIVDFPAGGGNPVLMVFLESTVRSMATIAGGSPFYIRNRIKDALRSGGEVKLVNQEFGGQTVAVQEVTFRPFAQDPNRARMGEFADLMLRFLVSDAVPGQFLLLSADTSVATTGYHEAITLSSDEVVE